MPSTYTQIYLHLIFAVMFEKSQISPEWEKLLYHYLHGILRNQGQELLAIGGANDHIHLLVEVKSDLNLSWLIRDLKSCSTKWINISGLNAEKFRWQTGFAAFSVGFTLVPQVKAYISREKERHKRESFLQEYGRLLDAHEIAYDERYIYRKLV